MALSSAKGRLTPAKTRPALIERLNTVRGARLRLLTWASSVLARDSSPLRLSAWLAAPVRVPTVDGKLRTMLVTCCTSLASAPRNICDRLSRVLRWRVLGRMLRSRPLGDMSKITCANATAAWPSTAAW